MLERVVVTPRGRVPQLEEPPAKKADGHFSHRSLKEKGSGAPGETRTPGPLLRSRLYTFIRTCRSWRKAGENQQVVTTSDQLPTPSSSPLSMLFAAICHD